MGKIGIVLGSTRPNRNGDQVAKWLVVGATLALGLTACSTTDQPTSGSSTASSLLSSAAASSPPTGSTGQIGSSTPSGSAASRDPVVDRPVTTATSRDLGDATPAAPADLAARLRNGGLVIVFRYTGAGGQEEGAPLATLTAQGVVDDGQRISDRSRDRMSAYGEKYRDLGIPVDQVLSSQYYFVWQHAMQAFGAPVAMKRDLTGSLNFSDRGELDRSLQGLRNRTVTSPPEGMNTVLFTHQGKFELAYGYYLDAGTTMVFEPDGSGTPRLIANLDYDDFMALS